MNVPKLRFKEFDGEWEEKKLDSFVTFYSGLTYSPDDIVKEKGTLVLRSSNVQFGSIVNADNVYVNPSVVNSEDVLEGDIIVVVRNGSRNLIGKHAQVKRAMPNTVIGAFMTGIRSKVPNFLNVLLDTKQFQKEINKNLGATINQITTGSFKKMSFLVSENIKEQEKIGNFFEILDKKIQLQQQKIYLLQEQKKGYMQKIFNQEIRFKDEKVEYPEWQNKSIDEVAKIIMGQSPDSKAYSEDPANTVLVQGNADLKNGKIVPRIYTSQLTKICEIGDIILTVRAPVGIVAKCNIPACIGRGVCAIKADDFLFYYLDYYNMTSQWAKLSQGSTFESVNSNDIKNIVVPQPCEEEKMKISKFFKRLMERIQLEEAKLLELKLQKQGFMQQLFV